MYKLTLQHLYPLLRAHQPESTLGLETLRGGLPRGV